MGLLRAGCVFFCMGAAAPAGAESFEVMVLRGAEVVRVTGDGSGSISEVTLREAPPSPAAQEAQPPSDPPAEQLIVVYQDEAPPDFHFGGVTFGLQPGPIPASRSRVQGRAIRAGASRVSPGAR
jgi:hypothetical protein